MRWTNENMEKFNRHAKLLESFEYVGKRLRKNEKGKKMKSFIEIRFNNNKATGAGKREQETEACQMLLWSNIHI